MADAARFPGTSARKMAGLRLAGTVRKNAIRAYSVEDLIAIVRPVTPPVGPRAGCMNPLDDTPTDAKRRRRKTD